MVGATSSGGFLPTQADGIASRQSDVVNSVSENTGRVESLNSSLSVGDNRRHSVSYRLSRVALIVDVFILLGASYLFLSLRRCRLNATTALCGDMSPVISEPSMRRTHEPSSSTSFWYQFLHFRLTYSFTGHFFVFWLTTLLIHYSLSLPLPA